MILSLSTCKIVSHLYRTLVFFLVILSFSLFRSCTYLMRAGFKGYFNMASDVSCASFIFLSLQTSFYISFSVCVCVYE